MDERFEADDDLPFSSFDPDAKAWFASLLFWRPSRLSDGELQLHFSHWDGRWSEQRKVKQPPRRSVRLYSVFNLVQLENLPAIYNADLEKIPDDLKLDCIRQMVEASGIGAVRGRCAEVISGAGQGNDAELFGVQLAQ
ncbi:hypothetical protein QCM80_22100 [Bradyrhizobium sp. SSUT112]|uniref:hypothetical protein n=1 Tax=Bradyrhizobium sp. SSUT112 TaxID=3040604 RepID=UPI002446EC74|nr:hypothetical protein [Bradyrhizobium sp. SSUT112]MDH2353330.1 hypothetical protein [Bradyrhizobium sp. SSUT112]